MIICSVVSLSAMVLTYKMSQTTSNITKTCNKCTNFIKTIKATTQFVVFLFVHSWEQRKLGEVSESYSGGTPSVGIKEYYGGQIPFIRSAEINSETTELFLTEEGLKNSSARLVAVGDILYALYGATSGEVGRAMLKGAINQAILAIKPNKDYDSEYLAQWLRKSKHRIIETYLQGGQGNLSGAIVKELSADFPSLKEQKTIGGFFRQLDNLITLHQRKDFSRFSQILRRKKHSFLPISWEQRKLGDIVDVRSGKDYKHLSEGNIPVYGTGGYMLSVNQALSYDEDAIGIGRKGTIDKPYILKAPFWTVDTLFYAVPRQNSDLDFVFDIFQNIDWKKKDESTGVPSLSKTAINEIDISAPCLEEQQVIGSYFSKIDNLITLHQCESCKKVGTVQSAFARRNLSKWADSWEQRKLGDIGTTFSGLSGKSKEDFGHGNAKFVTYMNVFSNPIASIEQCEKIEIDSKQSQVKYGDVFFTTSSETPEEVGMSSIWLGNQPNIYLNSFCFGYRPTIELDRYYLGFMLRSSSVRGNLILLAQGISRYNISKTKAMDIAIPVPNKDEQSKIGLFFSQLDNLITLHQCKVFYKNIIFKNIKFGGLETENDTSWEQRKLGDITQIIMGQSPDGSTYSDFPTDYILVQGNADLENGWVKPRIWTTQKTKYAVAGDLIMSVRAPAGSMGKTAYNVVLGRGVAAIKGNEFIFQVLTKMDLEGFWKKLSAGSTFESLNSDNIINANINLPSNLEQDKIGSIFENIDNLITLHQRIKIFFTGDYHDKKNK